jgi:hypothetical protein
MLDEYLPAYDVHEVHSTTVAADADAVLAAARELTAREVPLLVFLMALRAGPRVRRLSLHRTLLSQFERSGFVVLNDGPDGLAYGGVGRFWRPSGGLRRVDRSGFAAFAEPGYAKAAFDFRVRQQGDRALLTTETRVVATDASAKRSFRCYWRLISPGSGAIRIAWLRAIRKRAERTPGYAPRRGSGQPASSPRAPARNS